MIKLFCQSGTRNLCLVNENNEVINSEERYLSSLYSSRSGLSQVLSLNLNTILDDNLTIASCYRRYRDGAVWFSPIKTPSPLFEGGYRYYECLDSFRVADRWIDIDYDRIAVNQTTVDVDQLTKVNFLTPIGEVEIKVYSSYLTMKDKLKWASVTENVRKYVNESFQLNDFVNICPSISIYFYKNCYWYRPSTNLPFVAYENFHDLAKRFGWHFSYDGDGDQVTEVKEGNVKDNQIMITEHRTIFHKEVVRENFFNDLIEKVKSCKDIHTGLETVQETFNKGIYLWGSFDVSMFEINNGYWFSLDTLLDMLYQVRNKCITNTIGIRYCLYNEDCYNTFQHSYDIKPVLKRWLCDNLNDIDPSADGWYSRNSAFINTFNITIFDGKYVLNDDDVDQVTEVNDDVDQVTLVNVLPTRRRIVRKKVTDD